MRYFLVFLIQILFVSGGIAQTERIRNYLFSDIRVTGKFMVSSLIAEYEQDFSGPIKEFNNKSGVGGGIEITKQFDPHWEAGIELAVSTLSGEAVSPDFSAIGYHGAMMEPLTEPVMYRNRLVTPKLFGQYNFILDPFNNSTNIYLRAGIGYAQYFSELRYRDNWSAGLIFGKGIERFDRRGVATTVYSFTPGIRKKLFSGIELTAAVNLNMVNYDFLDVVHNYDDLGNRKQLRGVYTDFVVGISYFINDTGKFERFTKKTEKKDVGRTEEYLPFYRRIRK